MNSYEGDIEVNLDEENSDEEWAYIGIELNDDGGLSIVENKRTSEEMIKDIYFALSSRDLSPKAKRDIIEAVARDWTKIYGKYKGCRFWSKEAIELYKKMVEENNGRSITETELSSKFVHEHVVPIRELIRFFDVRQDLTADYIREHMIDKLIGAIVTKKENKKLEEAGLKDKMPGDFWLDDEQNPWWRYISVNIDIKQCWWEKQKQTKVLKSSKTYNIVRRLLQEDIEENEKFKYLDD